MHIRYGDEKQLSETTLLCNTGEGGLFSNVAANIGKGLPSVSLHRPAILCGGGPSLADELESIRKLKGDGGCIFSLNNAARFLVENGIKPDYQVIVDPREQDIEFLKEAWADELLLCSQCHPSLAERARQLRYPVRLWHPALDGIKQYLGENAMVVTVSLTVGLSAISLAHSMGHVDFHLFGYDCSHREGRGHAYRQDMNLSDEIVQCCADNKRFSASMTMAGQANQFKEFYDMMTQSFGCRMKLYGQGLLQTMVASWERDRALRVLNAVYDLGVSPPTYDFLSFLIEAERHRRSNGYDRIDLMIQPGPMHGFRDDDLAPDLSGRQDMLWRVVMGMARLLPSVRNIWLQGTRWQVPEADIFPMGYKQETPISHYGTAFLKGGEPLLRATDSAREQVAARYPKPYATISLREASYWPDRNSNRASWHEVALWLQAQGLAVVVVPDTNGSGLDGVENFLPACFDIDLRAALYEGALINMGVLNGPMSLLAYLKARYLIVKVNVETALASSTGFLAAHGFHNGDDFGGNGKMIWKSDSAENIIAELQEFAVKPKEITS